MKLDSEFKWKIPNGRIKSCFRAFKSFYLLPRDKYAAKNTVKITFRSKVSEKRPNFRQCQFIFLSVSVIENSNITENDMHRKRKMKKKKMDPGIRSYIELFRNPMFTKWKSEPSFLLPITELQ